MEPVPETYNIGQITFVSGVLFEGALGLLWFWGAQLAQVYSTIFVTCSVIKSTL
jgi:hypothetical protein